MKILHRKYILKKNTTLACEDANSKLVDVDVVTVADEDRGSNSLLQIWKLRFDHKT